jgi:hypothetical protein
MKSIVKILFLCFMVGVFSRDASGAGRYLYVDCDADSNSVCAGTTTDPLKGMAGIQRAVRQNADGGAEALGVANADNNDIVIWVRDTLTVNDGIELDANDSTAPGWKRIIGCSGSGTMWTPLAIDNYVIFSATGTDLGEAILKIGAGGNVNRISIRSISFRNNDSNGGAPGAGEDGIALSASAATYDFSISNCDFTNVYTAIEGANNNIYRTTIYDCNMSRIVAYLANTTRGHLIRGLFGSVGASSNGIKVVSNDFVSYVTVIGGVCGLYGTSVTGLCLSNSNFYNQTAQCVNVATSLSGRIYDCIFYVNDEANDYAIYAGSAPGVNVIRNCITNCNTRALAGFWGNSLLGGTFNAENSFYNLDFTNTDPWTNASGGDFCYGTGTISTTYVKDLGFRMYGDGSTANRGYSSIGSWQATQTQAGGETTTNIYLLDGSKNGGKQ